MDVSQKLTGLFNGAFLYYDIIEPQCLIFVCGVKAGIEDEVLVGQMVKNPPTIRETGSIPGLGRSPGGSHDNPLQNSCLENPHGQRNLAGYSPWGHKESRHN